MNETIRTGNRPADDAARSTFLAGEGAASARRRLRTWGAVFVVAALAPAVGWAQAGSLAQPNLGSAAALQSLQQGSKEGGLRSGEFILTPSIEVDGHHDTNVFNGNAEEAGNTPRAATSLRLIPRLGLNNGSDSDVQFNFDAAGDARIYISDEATVDNLTRFGGSADLGVTFFKRRSISLTVWDNFRRSLQANTWETTQTLNRISNSVGARVAFHPGEIPERRPLEIALSGGYVVDTFDDFAYGDTKTIRTRLDGSWRFLPRTAVLLDARWDFREYDTANPLGTTTDSTPWRVQAGLSGAFTETLGFRLVAGWGMSLHDTTDDRSTFSGFIGSAGLVYRPSLATLLALSYDRDFVDSLYGNFFSYDSVTMSLRQAFGTKVAATAWFTYAFASFGYYFPRSSIAIQPQRNDHQLRGGLRTTIDLSRVLGLSLGYQFRGIVSDFKIENADRSKILDAGAYTAHEIFAGVIARY